MNLNITQQIAQHIIEVSEGGNWTEMDIRQLLADLGWQEAVTVTRISPNSIAALLHHLSYWNRIMVQRVQGIRPDIPDSNGFDVAEIHSQQEWQLLMEDHFRSAHELADAIASVADDRLGDPILPGFSSVYKNLQGSVEHLHYHLGQMVMLKKMLRSGAA